MNRPRRVLIQLLSPHDAMAGGAIHARGVARGLRQHGIACSVLCTGGTDESPLFDEVIRVRPPSLPLLWRWEPLGHFPAWISAAACATRFDAVVSLSALPAVATRWAAPRVPLLYCPAILDRVEHAGQFRPAFRWFEQRALRDADGVIIPAPCVLDAIQHLYGLRPAKIGISPLGLEAGAVREAGRDRAELGIPPEVPLLITVGTLNENKGQIYIARALTDAPNDVWWAVVGDGPGRRELEHALRGTRLGTRTILAGNDPYVSDWWSAADLFIGASRHETFGLAVAEALHAGVPVVIPRDTRAPVLSPLVGAVERYGLGAAYTRCDDVELRNAVRAVLDDDAARKAMGDRARRYARKAFRWERYAACVLRILRGESFVDVTPSPDCLDALPDSQPPADRPAEEYVSCPAIS